MYVASVSWSVIYLFFTLICHPSLYNKNNLIKKNYFLWFVVVGGLKEPKYGSTSVWPSNNLP